jgi:hypothetical protein
LSDLPYPNAVRRFPRLRQSLLATYDDCALSARFEIDYTRGFNTHPQGRGTLFHRFAAEALRTMALHNESIIDPDVAMGIFDDVLRQATVDDTCHEPGCDLPATVLAEDEREEDGRELACADGHRHYSAVVNVPARERADLGWIVRKWARDNVWDIAHLVDVERRLEATVYYPDPAGGSVERLLTGQLDAMFVDPADATHAIVIDHKDTWRLPPPTEVSFEGYFQQRFYAFLVMRAYRTIQKVTLREFYVRYSEPREATLTREHINEIEADVSALVERFDASAERGSWRPTPGRHCSFCARPQACPIPVHVRAEGRITDREQAQRLGAQLVVAEVVLAQTRKALQSYVDIHGPVPVKDSKGNTVWGYERIERVSKPTAEQVREAMATGQDPAGLFKARPGTRFGKITLHPGQEQNEDDALAAALRASLEWSTGKGKPDGS